MAVMLLRCASVPPRCPSRTSRDTVFLPSFRLPPGVPAASSACTAPGPAQVAARATPSAIIDKADFMVRLLPAYCAGPAFGGGNFTCRHPRTGASAYLLKLRLACTLALCCTREIGRASCRERV